MLDAGGSPQQYYEPGTQIIYSLAGILLASVSLRCNEMRSRDMTGFFLVCMMLFSSFPVLILMDHQGIDGSFVGGTGTQEDPFLIEDVLALQAMGDDLAAHYALANAIDARGTSEWNEGAGFIPVGSESDPFTGSFDGRGHSITGLSIQRSSSKFIGLFGYVLDADVKNVNLFNVNITGYTFTGPLVGNFYSGTLDNCTASGTVRGTDYSGAGLVGWNSGSISNSSSRCDVSGYQYTGGLVGTNGGNIFNCYATGEVTASSVYVGGLVGSNLGSLSACYASGDVSGDRRVGGLVGDNLYSVLDCFATGDVTGKSSVGGLAGLQNGAVSNSYAVGAVTADSGAGGIAGEGAGSAESCYWDIYTTGQTLSSGGEGRTTAEMMQRATYFRWDFENVWSHIEGETYPWLRSLPNRIEPRILSPMRSGTLVRGDTLRFSGSRAPDLAYHWTIGKDRTASVRSPGLVNFPEVGNNEVFYTLVHDGVELSDRDTRTFVVIDDTTSHPDLIAVSMDIPDTLAPGGSSTIAYSAMNIGGAPLPDEGWHDAVYLSTDAYLDSGDRKLASTSVAGGIAPGSSYDGVMEITFPLLKEGPYYLILSLNDDWSFVERHRLNNEMAEEVDVAILELEEGVAYTGAYPSGQVDQYFRLRIPSGKNLVLTLDGPVGLELCARHAYLPTRANHDGLSDSGRMAVPGAYPGTWYILVQGDRMPSSGSYTIKFETVSLFLYEADPNRHVRGLPLELMLAGTGFIDPVKVELIGPDGGTYEAASVEVHLPTQLTAGFSAGALPEDVYSVRISRSDVGTAELVAVLNVLEQGSSNFEARIIMPEVVGYNSPATIYVEYENSGDVSIPAPLLSVTGTQGDDQGPLLTLDIQKMKNGMWTMSEDMEDRNVMPLGFSSSVQMLASGKTSGVIHPGETRRIPVHYVGWERPWNMDLPPVDWRLGMLGADNDEVLDKDAMKEHMRPGRISAEAWDIIWSNFITDAGDTWGDYVRMVGRNALYLHRQGQRVEDVGQLLALSISMAEGYNPLSVLSSEQDALVEAPGFPITFERYHQVPISRRFEMGPLGRGWTHNWQERIEVKDGKVHVIDGSGSIRVFERDIRFTGRHLGQPGERGDLRTMPGGGYRLKEHDGHLRTFRSDGRLDRIQDTNGNSITCTYTIGSLTRLSHSSGQFLEISYDGNGRITSVSDPHGRETTYAHDGEYMVQVKAYDGYTTDHEYDRTPNSAKLHAMTGIAVPGSGEVSMEYDVSGRLISIFRAGEGLTFTYGLGTVSFHDGSGNADTYHFDHMRRITRTENSLGDTDSYLFEGIGRLTEVTDPAGLSQRYVYDNDGDLIEMTDQMGHTTRSTYSGDLHRLSRIVDAKGNGNGYGYDERGNPIDIFHPDGTKDLWTYDQKGNILTWTNRRGNTTSYSYDEAGRLTRKVHEDGVEVKYGYDQRGNLIEVEDTSGITEFVRDEHDRIVRINYPLGQWLEFTYDRARRRNSSIDHLGLALKYVYDATGRIEALTDGDSIDIVRYEYDSAGRLSKKTVGNGVQTTYGYDPAGRISTLVSHGPGGDVISSFDHAYDERGRRVGVDAHYGSWSYEYDEIDQLTRAVLDPVDAGIRSLDMRYTYDALGNRIETVVNGEAETYEVNRLNQYTRIGDKTYRYDADGNLVEEDGPEGSVIYSYDDENRLVGVVKDGDVRTFAYDGLGNRVSMTDNGQRVHHIIDPIGLGDLVGVYDDRGDPITRYVHGPGLIGLRTDAGELYYHVYDALGNAHGLTGSDGSIVNSYAYGPFGDPIHEQFTVANPFRFGGEKGVMTDPTGLVHMRARHYGPRIGRFLSTDPIGIQGGDVNLYRYVRNSPTNLIDPTGLMIDVSGVANPMGFMPWSEVYGATMGTPGQVAGAGLDIYFAGSTAIAGFTLLATATGALPFLLAGGLIVWGSHSILKSVFTLVFIAMDPNQKLGPSGIGPENHIKEGSTLSYHIDFENLEDATAPAQIVIVRDPLSEHLDLATFEFTQIGFGDVIIPLESGTRYLEEVVRYRFEDEEYDMDIEVHIHAGIDIEIGEIFVNFYSIDPETGLLPTVETGFLPPEDGSGRGQGHFSYLISPREDLSTGTEIRNIATIQFDLGLSIDTNQIDPMDRTKGTDPDLEALVTIDAGPPVSRVEDLPSAVFSTFEVYWSGEDDIGGSGIASYDIFVSENGGDWVIWLEGTDLTSDRFEGEIGNTYGFFSVAVDNVGHREEKTAGAETAATVVILSGPTANAGLDRRVRVGDAVLFDGSASSDDVGIKNYTWTFDDGTGDIILYGVGPVHVFSVPGVHTVVLNVTNAGGLRDTDTMTVTVDPVVDGPEKENIPLILAGAAVLALIMIIAFIVCLFLLFILIRSRRDRKDEE